MQRISIPYWYWKSLNRFLALFLWSMSVFFVQVILAKEVRAAENFSEAKASASAISEEKDATKIYKERLLEVDINEQRLEQTVLVLEDSEGMLYLLDADLKRWRMKEPSSNLRTDYDGQRFYPLSALKQVKSLFDEPNLALILDVEPEAFIVSTHQIQYGNLTLANRSGSGGFMNYDLYAINSTGVRQQSGQFELGYFNQFGVGTSNFFIQSLNGNNDSVRLDSTWTNDNPEKMQTLRLGDVISSPGTWGRAVRFGGVQFGRNFSTQPGFVTLPMQGVTGQAVLPSTVDVFINNALVSRQNVPPGPFSIMNLPIVTGAGQVQLVVRDLMGRQQVINQPFYASQALLKKGLESYSYDFGVIRENFGINSNDYNNWLGSINYRRGLTDSFTGEVHAEVQQSLQDVGFGGDYLIPKIGTLSSYVAASIGKTATNSLDLQTASLIAPVQPSSNPNSGVLAKFGFDRFAQPWSFSGRIQLATSGFTQVGQPAFQTAPASQTSTNVSYTMGTSGSIGIAYIGQVNRELPNTSIVSVSYSISISKVGYFSISALRDLAGNSGTSLYSMLTIALDTSTSISVGGQTSVAASNGNSNNLATTLQRNLPSGDGYGYLVQARSDNTGQASYSHQNSFGTYMVGVAQDQDSTAMRFNTTGGIAVLGGDLFFGRRIDQSFAVASIPDYPNVEILADNQPVARTNSNGNALIPRLRAYDRNTISIDPMNLPLDARVNAITVDAIPYYRSGVVLKFPIHRSYGATMTIQLENGSFMPVGSTVQIDQDSEIFTVGFDGEVYVAGLTSKNLLTATGRGKTCFFEFDYEVSTDPLPDLGVFICKGVKP